MLIVQFDVITFLWVLQNHWRSNYWDEKSFEFNVYKSLIHFLGMPKKNWIYSKCILSLMLSTIYDSKKDHKSTKNVLWWKIKNCHGVVFLELWIYFSFLPSMMQLQWGQHFCKATSLELNEIFFGFFSDCFILFMIYLK